MPADGHRLGLSVADLRKIASLRSVRLRRTVSVRLKPDPTIDMTPAERLRALLERPGILVMPGCHDAMSARLIEEAGFELGFMSGFAVSAARLGMPDTGLISYGELVNQGQNICRAVSIPLIGDGDTGSAARRTSSARCRGTSARASPRSCSRIRSRRNAAATRKGSRSLAATRR